MSGTSIAYIQYIVKNSIKSLKIRALKEGGEIASEILDKKL